MLAADEPFAALFTQGMILRHGAVMSKSKGNGVEPDEIVRRYGADTGRIYELFIGPPDQDAEWNDRGVEGISRFLNRVFRLVVGEEELASPQGQRVEERDLLRCLHETIDKVTRDVDAFHFNTAISALMILVNRMQDYLQGGGVRNQAWDSVALGLTRLLAPFAPHLAEELWERQGQRGLVTFSEWPAADPALLARSLVTVVVQVDGRLRDRIEIPSGASEDEVRRRALKSEKVRRALGGRDVARAVLVPDRLINLVSA
jgi:leucyl-tRNA synthetase